MCGRTVARPSDGDARDAHFVFILCDAGLQRGDGEIRLAGGEGGVRRVLVVGQDAQGECVEGVVEEREDV